MTWEKESWRGRPIHLSAFGASSDGELYLVDHDRTHQIYRLEPDPASKVARDFPRRLSQTGLFASTRDHQPATGVIAYSVNAEPGGRRARPPSDCLRNAWRRPHRSRRRW